MATPADLNHHLHRSLKKPQGETGKMSTTSRRHLTEEQIYGPLTEIFEEVLDEELAVTPELSAEDVDGWDSLTHIRLILSIEKRFNVKFSNTEIGRLRNVGDLVNLILQRA
jgi:acyl carrier protein